MATSGDLPRPHARRPTLAWLVGWAAIAAGVTATPAAAIGPGVHFQRVEGRARVARPARPTFVSSSPAGRQSSDPGGKRTVDRPALPVTGMPVRPGDGRLVRQRHDPRRLRGPNRPAGAALQARGVRAPATCNAFDGSADMRRAAPAAVFHDANAPPLRSASLIRRRA